MKKTLFVQIDNTPAPIEVENSYISLDCRQINDFCSFVGDVLVGDLKDDNGTPIYRLLKSMGHLLSDFEAVEKECFNSIISQWWDMIGEMLHEGLTQCDKRFVICFPRLYVDWLRNNENEYYAEIGENLLLNHGRVWLDAYGISEDIISALHMKINRFLNEQKEEIEYVVFSNKRIGNSSKIIKQLRSLFDNYSFLRYEQWEHILIEEKQRKIENLEDYRAFWLDDLKLGVTTKEDIPQSRKDYYKYFHLEFNKDGKLSRMCTQPHTDSVNTILAILFNEKNMNWEEFSYNKMASFLLLQKGFSVSTKPYREFITHSKKYMMSSFLILQLGFSVSTVPDRKFHTNSIKYRYEATLCKDTDNFLCTIRFVYLGDYMEVFDFEKRKGTLYEVDIKLK